MHNSIFTKIKFIQPISKTFPISALILLQNQIFKIFSTIFVFFHLHKTFFHSLNFVSITSDQIFGHPESIWRRSENTQIFKALGEYLGTYVLEWHLSTWAFGGCSESTRALTHLQHSKHYIANSHWSYQ